jgi:hypothetical protein
MIYFTSRHQTEEQATQAGETMLRGYHPCGYGTRYRVWQDKTSGEWVMDGSRYSSCD